MTTSKIMLGAWIVLGGVLLIKGVGPAEGTMWACGLLATVWNRIDSRKRGYKMSLSLPGGGEARLESKGEK